MLVHDKNYMQMTMDFEEKAVICVYLFHFRKKRSRKMGVQPLIGRSLLKGQFHNYVTTYVLVFSQFQ
jgi:hypothetical protein